MTGETLKPFITPQNVEIFPSNSERRLFTSKFLDMGLIVAAVILTTVLLVFTIWALVRVSALETEIESMRAVIKNIQNRLGSHYLEDLLDFEEKYKNAIADNPIDEDEVDESIHPKKDKEKEDEENDSDQYDVIENVNEFLSSYGGDSNSDNDDNDDDDGDDDDDEESYISEDDNLYDDFEKYQDSKKKKQGSRQMRSVQAPIGVLYDEEHKSEQNYTGNTTQQKLSASDGGLTAIHSASHQSTDLHMRHFVSDNLDKTASPLRPRSHRGQKIPMVRNAKSIPGRSPTSLTRGAHFHLVDKKTTYPGDMYIGRQNRSRETEQYFIIDNGLLIIREPGQYYIYAQVCYNNTHDQNGFVIYHGQKPFLQCLNTVPTNMLKIHTCHTSGLIYLGVNETIHLRDIHNDRTVILKEANNRSYFGLFKI